MSKLAHSNDRMMEKIEKARLKRDGFECPFCLGTGVNESPYSGPDPVCPECDGIGYLVE
jgi:hypothetical protein|tara:strand:- start:619 stop:795 length:177 start_codon:yes stop_codon:yes gene_type:complete